MPAIPPPFRVALIGECMIELKETASGALTRGFGGDTFNTAAYMARLGARLGPFVDYVSAVGDDPFSAEMVAYWNANGVGSELTAVLPNRRPGLYFISVDATGERRFAYWRGEAGRATPSRRKAPTRLSPPSAASISSTSAGSASQC